ncbi:MAG: TetR/AcrR family transcriptional regulator [Acidimicrobiia bacterium]
MAVRSASTSTRDAMLDAARDLIAEFGYTSMSHADITASVGMGRTTFYEHFGSKEDLLIELVRRDLPPLIVDILQSVDSALPPAERLHALARKMVQFVGTDHLGLILHTEVPLLSPGAQRDIAGAHGGIADEFASIYRDGVDAGEFRPMPRMLVGRMMEGIIMTGGKVVMDSPDPKASVEELASATADTLVAALRAPS